MEVSVLSRDAAAFVNHLVHICESSSHDSSEPKPSLEEFKEFLTKSVTLLNSKISSKAKEVIVLTDDQKGDTILECPDIQMLEPRGRFKFLITSTCLHIEGKAGGGMIPLDQIINVTLLPSHTSSKKEGEDYLAISFEKEIKICGKDMKSVLFNLSKTLPKGSEATVETESTKVVEALKQATGRKINQPNPNIFRTVNQQKAFLRCHRGTQEGAIYPLFCGVFFVKPLLWIPADDIASISAGRGGGSGNTRFVDVRIESVDDKVYEFVNIDREELPAIQGYVKGYLENRRRKQEEAKAAAIKAAGGKSENDDDEDDDDDDDDYNPDASESSDENDDDDDDDSGSEGSAASSDDDSDDDDRPKKKTAVKKEVTKTSKKRPIDLVDNHDKQEFKKITPADVKVESETVVLDV